MFAERITVNDINEVVVVYSNALEEVLEHADSREEAILIAEEYSRDFNAPLELWSSYED